MLSVSVFLFADFRGFINNLREVTNILTLFNKKNIRKSGGRSLYR